jgi:hypothetical protein
MEHTNNENKEIFLEDCWSLYFHDPDDSQWTKESYKVINSFSTVADWAKLDLLFKDVWIKGMFFLMREHIQPLWEDPFNKNGGCFSFKVNKPEAGAYFFKICAQMMSNNLAKGDSLDIHDNICGISMSPKRNYCIVRIWIGSKEFNKAQLYNTNAPSYTQVLFKNHEENNDFTPNSKDTTTK